MEIKNCEDAKRKVLNNLSIENYKTCLFKKKNILRNLFNVWI